MPTQVGRIGATGVSYIGSDQNTSSFSTSTPAGWAMIWWGLSILIIVAMFMAL